MGFLMEERKKIFLVIGAHLGEYIFTGDSKWAHNKYLLL